MKHVFVRLHIHTLSPKAYALGFQPQPLLDRIISPQLDLAAGSQHTLPRQSERAVQRSRHQARISRQARCPRYRAVG